MRTLVNNTFWASFWKSKPNISVVNANYYFSDIFKKISLEKHINKTFVEIGGFPGNYAIYAKKYLKFNATLIDLYIDKKQINRNITNNGLVSRDIEVIKGNIFSKSITRKQFGIVFSSGFIEHFNDIKAVIKRHVDLCEIGGYVIIAVPNFLGLNGLLQKYFDPENLNIHNLKAMDITYLTGVIHDLRIKQYSIKYYGNFGLWLERIESRGVFLKALIYAAFLIKLVFSLVRINNRLFSPFVLITIKNEKTKTS